MMILTGIITLSNVLVLLKQCASFIIALLFFVIHLSVAFLLLTCSLTLIVFSNFIAGYPLYSCRIACLAAAMMAYIEPLFVPILIFAGAVGALEVRMNHTFDDWPVMEMIARAETTLLYFDVYEYRYYIRLFRKKVRSFFDLDRSFISYIIHPYKSIDNHILVFTYVLVVLSVGCPMYNMPDILEYLAPILHELNWDDDLPWDPEPSVARDLYIFSKKVYHYLNYFHYRTIGRTDIAEWSFY